MPGTETLSLGENSAGNDVETAPALIVALECGRPGAGGERFLLDDVAEVEVGRGDGRSFERLDRRGVRVGRIDVPDPFLSTVHFSLRREGDRFVLTDAGSKNGTLVDGARQSTVVLGDGALLAAAKTWFVFQQASPTTAPPDDAIATFDPHLMRELAALWRLAGTDLPILLHGETGTGKEVAARAVHERARRTGPFVAVNLAAVPADLLEGQLFGHRRGAFTGATEERAGLVRAAHGGTLFLDEVAELPLPGQAALLRVLQEREVTPLGATTPIPVDIRIVAATHQNLAARVAAGEFRQDLLARLAGHTVHLPALRERRVDLGLLIARLLQRAGGADARLSRSAAARLFEHDWPLNIRELDHALRRAIALVKDAAIEPRHLGLDEPPPASRVAASPATVGKNPSRDRDGLLALFARHSGNVAAVARELNTSPSHVRRLMERHGLDLDAVRRGEV